MGLHCSYPHDDGAIANDLFNMGLSSRLNYHTRFGIIAHAGWSLLDTHRDYLP